MTHNLTLSKHLLTIEETLTNLDECLDNDRRSTQQHIQTLKTFYSPLFDFDYSESGSYYYAGLRSLCHHYIEQPVADLNLSDAFKHSLITLEQVSLLSLDRQKNHSALTDQLLALADVWQLNQTMDVPELIQQALRKMRYDVIQSNLPPVAPLK